LTNCLYVYRHLCILRYLSRYARGFVCY